MDSYDLNYIKDYYYRSLFITDPETKVEEGVGTSRYRMIGSSS